jgi:hypothetical protein
MGGLNDLIDGEAETLDQRLERRGGTGSLMPTATPPGREKDLVDYGSVWRNVTMSTISCGPHPF